MDIGTAKPTPAERAAVPHYLLDLIEPDETYSSQRFAVEGTRVLKALEARGRMALVTGGTGYYLQALLDRPQVPHVPPDPALRAALREEAVCHGPESLHVRLSVAD